MNMACIGEPVMKSRVTLSQTIAAGMIAALAAFATTAASAAEAVQKNTNADIKSDAKAAGKGVKGAAVDVGTQIGTGTKKAYRADKAKIKKDIKDGKPGDGSYARKNDAAPTSTLGHK